jgi:hypothetical protein
MMQGVTKTRFAGLWNRYNPGGMAKSGDKKRLKTT